MTVLAEELPAHLPEYLARQRWFPAKGRPVSGIAVATEQSLIDDGALLLDLCLLRVGFADGPAEFFQVLVGRRHEPASELEHATIGAVGDRIAFDAMWDHEATAFLLTALREGRTYGDVRFVPEPGVELPAKGVGRLLGVEQSNTSVAYGEKSIFKLFRKVSPGLNPDLELHRALRSVGSNEVASLQGAVEGLLEGEPATLGMLQDFASNSAEGWAMALTSVRDLFAEADLYADEVGGDFAAESRRLGETVAVAHRELAQALGTGVRPADELRAQLETRLDAVVSQVPELAPHEKGIRAVYARLTGDIAVQRVHGDLHLGQTLRTPKGWLLIDFEGEPATPLPERRRMDSPLRDVAGMLRSFDYAVYHQVILDEHTDENEEQQLLRRADEWAIRNRSAFCDGYAFASGADPRAQAAVLRAYELDKAVYEVIYETRSRPTWAVIPLSSITRLVAEEERESDPQISL
ncbi:aminoglycoside phosphotransferase [Pseudonocardia sp. WMMC193]|uniref:maltokinase N-terminal cap-like domain-containing protein n=1 Tax=Pseudonocardia sp. WMMC193 TaxID=2911965 RepID=UPI001F30EECB|nr:aminoglycoside phosphotransferase [Pseudonocardia sp. WMMC193]MCF7550337.1 aminoglycoside phosphotransferase [Pseudonocardia sp. WMMC193]